MNRFQGGCLASKKLIYFGCIHHRFFFSGGAEIICLTIGNKGYGTILIHLGQYEGKNQQLYKKDLFMCFSGAINRSNDGLDRVINFLRIRQKVIEISPLTPLFKRGEIPPRRDASLFKERSEGIFISCR